MTNPKCYLSNHSGILCTTQEFWLSLSPLCWFHQCGPNVNTVMRIFLNTNYSCADISNQFSSSFDELQKKVIAVTWSLNSAIQWQLEAELTGTPTWETKYEGKFIKTAENGRVTGATNGSQTLFWPRTSLAQRQDKVYLFNSPSSIYWRDQKNWFSIRGVFYLGV